MKICQICGSDFENSEKYKNICNECAKLIYYCLHINDDLNGTSYIEREIEKHKRIDRFIYAIEKGERSGRLNTAADSQEYEAPDYDEWRRRY